MEKGNLEGKIEFLESGVKSFGDLFLGKRIEF